VTVRDERFERLLGSAAPLVAATFDALPDAIGIHWPIVDAGGAIVDFELGYTNPSSERLTGVKLSDDRGARLREVMPGVVEMGLYDRLVRVVETGEPESAEIQFDTPYREIRVQGVWMHSVLPFGPGVMSIAFDVTEERRRENELRDFAELAAHDLREPLTGVHLLVSLLRRRGGLGADDQKIVGLVGDGVERARGLVDGILDYATAGGDIASRGEVDCGAVVAEVLAALAPQIESASASVQVDTLPTVRGSRAALARVFQNLIANAVKFRNGDAPGVWVSATRDAGGWTFTVRDNGLGLPETTAIFEMFKRGSGRHEGSGIGLATCRRIVEAHGGRIWAHPAPDGGSRFSFTLPD
jgi:signal transduction histidine kinase